MSVVDPLYSKISHYYYDCLRAERERWGELRVSYKSSILIHTPPPHFSRVGAFEGNRRPRGIHICEIFVEEHRRAVLRDVRARPIRLPPIRPHALVVVGNRRLVTVPARADDTGYVLIVCAWRRRRRLPPVLRRVGLLARHLDAQVLAPDLPRPRLAGVLPLLRRETRVEGEGARHAVVRHRIGGELAARPHSQSPRVARLCHHTPALPRLRHIHPLPRGLIALVPRGGGHRPRLQRPEQNYNKLKRQRQRGEGSARLGLYY